MKTILIIEDDPKIVAALEIRFQAAGYATHIVKPFGPVELDAALKKVLTEKEPAGKSGGR